MSLYFFYLLLREKQTVCPNSFGDRVVQTSQTECEINVVWKISAPLRRNWICLQQSLMCLVCIIHTPNHFLRRRTGFLYSVSQSVSSVRWTTSVLFVSLFEWNTNFTRSDGAHVVLVYILVHEDPWKHVISVVFWFEVWCLVTPAVRISAFHMLSNKEKHVLLKPRSFSV